MKFRPPAGDAPLRHGYTVSQVRALSLAVVTRQTWYQSVDFDQRLEVAWHAIIEHIYASDQPPEMPAVARAAERAVGQDVQQYYRFHGINRPRLVTEHREVRAALTMHEDYGLAAEALGISRSWFTERLSAARRAFLRAWHAGEIPSRPWAQDWHGLTTADRLVAANRTIAARRLARRRAQSPQPGQRRPGPPRLDLGISDAELVRRYEAGQSIRQLAASLGTRYGVVHYRLKAEGAQLRPANGHPHPSTTTTRKG